MKNLFHLLRDVPTSFLPNKPSVMKADPIDVIYNGELKPGTPLLIGGVWHLVLQVVINLDRMERGIYLYDRMGYQISFNINAEGPYFMNLTNHSKKHNPGFIQN